MMSDQKPFASPLRGVWRPQWFLAERRLAPAGLIALGSDAIEGYADYDAATMQGARYESGLDNSPMYVHCILLHEKVSDYKGIVFARRAKCSSVG